MANYTGVHCPVCKKRFTDDDDIVVCPICGAPHHRECYRQLGHCALDELHIKGHTWQPEGGRQEDRSVQGSKDGAASGDSTACPACGAHNPTTGLFCQICGAPLKGPAVQPRQAPPPYGANGFGSAQTPFKNAYTLAFGGLSPEEEIDGFTARDAALFIGENSQYFLPRFKKMSEGSPVSFNFCALIFNFLYFFYRKMYFFGGLLLGLVVLTQIPTFFVMPEYTAFILANIEDISMGIMPAEFIPQTNLWAWAVLPYMRYFTFGISIAFAAFANRFYMGFVLRSVKNIRARFLDQNGQVADDRAYVDELAYRGRTSRAAVIAVLGSVIACYFMVCFLIAGIVAV